MDPISPTRPQRVRALQRANEVRHARARIKRRIATGDLTAAEVILSHPSEVESMRIAEVLLSQRHWGSRRCDAFLVRMSIHEHKRIGSLTERQRLAAAALLTANSPERPQKRSPTREHMP